MELWICRHAETLGNKQKLLQGQTDSDCEKELSELGYIQAKLVAKRLSKIKFSEIISSDLRRTKITTNEIYNESENKSDVKVTLSDLVREKNGGILEKKPLGILNAVANLKGVDIKVLKPKDGESGIDLFIRARNFLYKLIDTHVKPGFIDKVNSAIDVKMKVYTQSSLTKIENEVNGKPSDLAFKQREDKIDQEMEKVEKLVNVEKLLMKINDDDKDIQEQSQVLSKLNQCFNEDDVTSIVNKMLSRTKEADEINTDYNEEEISEYINQLDLSYLNEKPYSAFDPNDQVKRLLLVSHSGFISELINVIRKLWNIKPNTKNETVNTGIHVIRIYCVNCGTKSVCQNLVGCNKKNNKIIEFDFLLSNDSKHLSILNEDI